MKEPLLGPQWRLAQTDRFEVLSRSNDVKARAMVEAYRAAFAKLEVLLPPRFVAAHDLPIKLIIYDESLWPRSTQEEVAAMLASISDRVPRIDLAELETRRDTPFYDRLTRPAETHFERLRKPWITSEAGVVPFERERAGPPAVPASVFFTDMRLTDLDAVVIFSLAPEGYNHHFSISLRSTLVAHLMGKRTPSLPPWFMRGFLEVYREVEFDAHGLRLPPLQLDPTEPSAAAKPDLEELTASFVPILDLLSVREPETDFFARSRQLGVFIRWALDPENDRARAFWQLLDEACHQPVDAAALQRAFNLSPAELDQQLRDSARTALRRSLRWPQPRVEPAEISFSRASSLEVARIKGDWERLETNWVRHNHRELLERYAEKAHRTLHRGGWRGDRDPHLLTNRALFAYEAGDLAEAIELLENARTHEVTLRPRAYLVLAQARWTRWQDDHRGMDQALPADAAAPWLELLREAARAAPQMPEAFHTYVDIAKARRRPLSPEDVNFLHHGLDAFPRDTTLAAALAAHYRQNSQPETARDLVRRTIALGAKDEHHPRWSELQNTLRESPAAPD